MKSRIVWLCLLLSSVLVLAAHRPATRVILHRYVEPALSSAPAEGLTFSAPSPSTHLLSAERAPQAAGGAGTRRGPYVAARMTWAGMVRLRPYSGLNGQ